MTLIATAANRDPRLKEEQVKKQVIHQEPSQFLDGQEEGRCDVPISSYFLNPIIKQECILIEK